MELARRGRKRRLGIEDEYWQLILTTVGTVKACKMVGIGRKTGYRWRAERGGLPPLRRVEPERSDRYLSLLERQRIATLRRQRLPVREIARRLGRASPPGEVARSSPPGPSPSGVDPGALSPNHAYADACLNANAWQSDNQKARAYQNTPRRSGEALLSAALEN